MAGQGHVVPSNVARLQSVVAGQVCGSADQLAAGGMSAQCRGWSEHMDVHQHTPCDNKPRAPTPAPTWNSAPRMVAE